MKSLIVIVFLSLSLFALDNFSDKTINDFKKKYKSNPKILLLWDQMINKAKKTDTLKKLKIVNDFFNKVRYATDIKHWKVIDYWATPTEFIGTRAGDCEDYAIAKYFTLLKVGVPSDKLRIAYVKLLHKRKNYEEAHMVLLYFHKLNSVPVVLDNAYKKLALATKRKDLKLIYSFNADGLWQAKNKGKEHVKKGANKLKKWKNLIEKL
jgi:predicted transglutaminase-like cysteine proteinase